MAVRESLPTLTEDELRTECERVTIPTPIPVDLLRRMMAEAEHGAPEPPASKKPARDVGEEEDLEIAEMPASAAAGVVGDLVQGYLQRLGGRGHVPFASLSPEHARALQLDHWAGFLLSLVDGATSIEDIVDAAPMPEHDTLRLLCDLQKHGIIDTRPR